jgi:hypothetical protein
MKGTDARSTARRHCRKEWTVSHRTLGTPAKQALAVPVALPVPADSLQRNTVSPICGRQEKSDDEVTAALPQQITEPRYSGLSATVTGAAETTAAVSALASEPGGR